MQKGKICLGSVPKAFRGTCNPHVKDSSTEPWMTMGETADLGTPFSTLSCLSSWPGLLGTIQDVQDCYFGSTGEIMSWELDGI